MASAEMSASKSIVSIKGLKKRFGANEVLKGIDLEVGAGEVIAIIGKSGSGKSTLLRCVNGLEVFDQGTLHVDGLPLVHGSKAAMRALREIAEPALLTPLVSDLEAALAFAKLLQHPDDCKSGAEKAAS